MGVNRQCVWVFPLGFKFGCGGDLLVILREIYNTRAVLPIQAISIRASACERTITVYTHSVNWTIVEEVLAFIVIYI